MSEPNEYDTWLTGDAAAAIVIRETLVPVEGADGVIFPATFAAAEDKRVFPGGYNIDPPEGDRNVCLVDSVGSQANRMEPLFLKAKAGQPENQLAKLVPQIEIDIGNDRTVSILDAGHRLGDAIVRASDLMKDAKEAFAAYRERGDASLIAKLAPTTLVFGAWDSRGEGAWSARRSARGTSTS